MEQEPTPTIFMLDNFKGVSNATAADIIYLENLLFGRYIHRSPPDAD